MRSIECFLDPVCPWCWVTASWLRVVRDATGLDVRWRFLSLALLDAAAARPRVPRIAAIHDRGHEHLTVLAAVRRLAGPAALDRAVRAVGAAIWESRPDGRTAAGDDLPAAHAWAARPLDLRSVLSSVGADPSIVAEVAPVDVATVAGETATAVRRVGRGLGTPVITLDPPDGPSFFGPVLATAPTDPVGAVRLWDALRTLATQPGFAELRTNRRAPVDVPLMRALPRPDVERGDRPRVGHSPDVERVPPPEPRRPVPPHPQEA